ncbi:hypothetical protein Sjap_023879 [Stephania japonica]|uniref:Uncharacterized protein n=1 Tax=Stephania japonica TaxID=461633 RepID=A0AAP0HN62_9MAGN
MDIYFVNILGDTKGGYVDSEDDKDVAERAGEKEQEQQQEEEEEDQEAMLESKENQMEELLACYKSFHESYKGVEEQNQEDCYIVNISEPDDSIDYVRDEICIEDVMQHDSGVDLEKFKTIA